MNQTVKSLSRMAAVQPPTDSIVSDLIRQMPETMSLGQGAVHWGFMKSVLA